MEPFGKLSVILLTRNEEKNVGRIIEDTVAKVEEPVEILVVDDSVDNTPSVVKEFSSRYPNVRLVPQEGEGYTNAFVTAVRHAQGRAMVVIVGDGSDEIGDIGKMREKLQEGYDIVCASRYMKGGLRTGGNLFQGLFSRLVGRSLKLLLGIQTCDISNSFKMYRKNVFEAMEIQDSSYATSMQVTLKAFFNGAKIAEIPTIWRNRASGSSKFLFRKQTRHYVYWYFWALLKSIFEWMRSWKD